MLFGNKAYKELFRALEAGETPVLFHCSAGKDRTGVAAILILLALGASDKTIAEDFEKTNIWRRPELEAVWAEHAEEIAADPARKDFYLGVFGVHQVCSLRAEHHPGALWQCRRLSGNRIRPHSGPPDAPAPDVSRINNNFRFGLASP